MTQVTFKTLHTMYEDLPVIVLKEILKCQEEIKTPLIVDDRSDCGNKDTINS